MGCECLTGIRCLLFAPPGRQCHSERPVLGVCVCVVSSRLFPIGIARSRNCNDSITGGTLSEQLGELFHLLRIDGNAALSRLLGALQPFTGVPGAMVAERDSSRRQT